MRKGALLLPCLLAAACHTEVQPIVIDLSGKTPTPSVAPAETPRVAPAEARTSPPAPIEAPAAPSPAVTPTPASRPAAGSPEQIVDGQLAARNRGDLEELLSFYAPDAKVYDGADRLNWSGRDDLRRHFAAHFSQSPGLRARVASRMVQGNYVVQQEEFEGGAEGPGRAVVVYEVAGGRIVRVWLLH